MAKHKKNRAVAEAASAAARQRAEELREMQRSGIVLRAVTFPNKRAAQSRNACRGRSWD